MNAFLTAGPSLAEELANTLFMTRKKRRRVLLVEDDVNDAELARFALENCDVTHAIDGASAMSKVMEETFDCAVIDLNLANASGLDLANRLRVEFPALKIIMCSGLVRQTSVILTDALKYGFCIIPKPIQSRDIPS